MWPKKAVGWARGGEGERNGDQEKERDEMQVGAQKGHGGKRRSDWAGLALNTRLGWWPLGGGPKLSAGQFAHKIGKILPVRQD